MIGTFLAIVIGIVTGFLSAWRRSGIVDQVSTNAAIVFYALPTQFIGMVLILLFAGDPPDGGHAERGQQLLLARGTRFRT